MILPVTTKKKEYLFLGLFPGISWRANPTVGHGIIDLKNLLT